MDESSSSWDIKFLLPFHQRTDNVENDDDGDELNIRSGVVIVKVVIQQQLYPVHIKTNESSWKDDFV